MKRLVVLMIILIMTVSATGCVFDVQNADIMRPPKLTTELESVKTALETYYGSGMKLINPSSGNQRAAVQFVDLNGDELQEAVAFFKDQNEQNALKVAILKKETEDNRWSAMQTIVGVGYEIDQVGFSDLNGDGNKEIIVGWLGGSMLSKGLSVYRVGDGETENFEALQGYEEVFRDVYTTFHILDLDMDGKDELLTFLFSRPDNQAEAKLYTMDVNGVQPMDTINLASDVHRYERLISGLVEDGRNGVVLDIALGAGASFSEALVWRDGQLNRVFGTSGAFENSKTYRYDDRQSEDVDGDGWIEIPTLVRPIGYEHVAKRDVPWITIWNHWNAEGDLQAMFKTYDDVSLGYRFKLPMRWNDVVTLTRNDLGIAFAEVQEDGIERRKIVEIMIRLRSETESTETQMKNLGFFELTRTMDYLYYGKIYPAQSLSEMSLGITEEEMMALFDVLK